MRFVENNLQFCSRLFKPMALGGLMFGVSLLGVCSAFAQVDLMPLEASVQDAPVEDEQGKSPVDFQADELNYDEENQIVRAVGNVELAQDGRILKAQEVIYDLSSDTVNAKGDVVLMDANGDVHFFQSATLNEKMKRGFIEGLRTTLSDGSRFSAEKGEREEGVSTVMYNASYTPCQVCKEDPEKSPDWQIRAAKVTHDDVKKSVIYEDAWLELGGVPILYTPYFAHADGSVQRKSGFLTPSAGWNSDAGFNVRSDYYWSIAPDKDATFGMQVFSDQMPMLHSQWRQRFANAALVLDGSVTHSKRRDSVGASTIIREEEVRGHVFGALRWDINDKWRAGGDVQWAADDQYLRQYDISSEDVLENDLYVERFSDRDYAAVHLLAFQDVRVSERRSGDQPDIIPEAEMHFLGDPADLLGGRWGADVSMLGVRRDGKGRDMNRVSTSVDWRRRMISGFGSVSVLDLSLRGDAYHIRDADGGRNDSFETRGFMNAYFETSYPLARRFAEGQMVLEPRVAVSLAPDISRDENIPNEDSQDVQLDIRNLFESNRFPGLDRIEDQSFVTYGFKGGYYYDDGSYIDAFLGQSYRFEEDNNPFAIGSGLSQQASDIVGSLAVFYDNVEVDYKFQFGGDDFKPERHELDLSLKLFERFDIGSRYLYANSLPDSLDAFSREQISTNARLSLNDNWDVHSGISYDLGVDQGLRQAYGGFDYYGDCIRFSTTARRTLTDDGAGDSDTEIFFRIGLKNLGEFSASGLNVSSQE